MIIVVCLFSLILTFQYWEHGVYVYLNVFDSSNCLIKKYLIHSHIMKPKVIAIVGPTASGKTALSINIAKKFNGEVISADSRQVYRGLDIGTGKVTAKEMGDIPHHLIDITDPAETYTAANYQNDASATIIRIQNRDKLPIIAGGTFFYIELLRGNLQSAPVPPNKKFRESIEGISNKKLFLKLKKLDPDRAKDIDADNRRRLIRALEIIDMLGKVPKPTKSDSPYEWLMIGINVPKEKLLDNFSERLDSWLKAGFQAEVEGLLSTGITSERLQEFGFEYTLMLSFINQEISLTELKEKFLQKNWQYAKRQMTWLKRDKDIKWFKPEERKEILKLTRDFLN